MRSDNIVWYLRRGDTRAMLKGFLQVIIIVKLHHSCGAVNTEADTANVTKS